MQKANNHKRYDREQNLIKYVTTNSEKKFYAEHRNRKTKRSRKFRSLIKYRAVKNRIMKNLYRGIQKQVKQKSGRGLAKKYRMINGKQKKFLRQ